MLAFVKTKWIIGNGFVTLLVHNSKAGQLKKLEEDDSFSALYCYHYECLSTTLREFRTIKQSEFCLMAPILFQPTLSLEKKNEMIREHKKTIDEANNVHASPEGTKFSGWSQEEEKGPEDLRPKMKAYLDSNTNLYNQSQQGALRKVIEMVENDVLLI